MKFDFSTVPMAELKAFAKTRLSELVTDIEVQALSAARKEILRRLESAEKKQRQR